MEASGPRDSRMAHREELTALAARPPRLAANRVLWALLFLGILLRLAFYLDNRSLWLDEAMLALNLVHRSWSGLLEPLDLDQGAPIGFLLAAKMATLLFGESEFALRLPSLVAGLASVPLCFLAARRLLGFWGVAATLFLFAGSKRLVYYAAECKQYSFDVALSLLLLLLFLGWRRDTRNLRRAFFAGLVGAGALWFSHSVLFVLAGFACGLGLAMVSERDWVGLRGLLVPGMLWILSLVLLYQVSLASMLENRTLLDYWREGFLPFPPLSWPDLKVLGLALFSFLEKPASLYPKDLPGLAWIAIPPVLVGLAALLRRRRGIALGFLLTFLAVLVASAARTYPFQGRLVLFLVPFVLLLIGAGVDRLFTWCRGRARFLGIGFLALLFFYPAASSAWHLYKPVRREEVRPLVATIRQRWRGGDRIAVHPVAMSAYRYYGPRFGFSVEDLVDPGKISEIRNSPEAAGRYWALISHIQNPVEERAWFDRFRNRYREVVFIRKKGAVLALYERDR